MDTQTSTSPARDVPGPTDPPLPSGTVVVMPALDEEDSVADAVEHWRRWGAKGVVVVNNGSRDRTAERAREAGASVVPEPRRGYGAAAWTGTRHAPPGTKWILFASADGSDFLDADASSALAEAIGDGALLVAGDRTRRPDARRHLTPVQRFGNRLCAWLIALGWRAPRTRDIGSLRIVEREAFEGLALADRGFGWNIEMQTRAIEQGLPIAEIPVGYRPRTAGRPKISGSFVGIARASRDILATIARLWWQRRRSLRERRG